MSSDDEVTQLEAQLWKARADKAEHKAMEEQQIAAEAKRVSKEREAVEARQVAEEEQGKWR